MKTGMTMALVTIGVCVAAAPARADKEKGSATQSGAATGATVSEQPRQASTTPAGDGPKAASSGGYVIGHVAEATKDRLVVEGKNRGMVTLHVGEETDITLEGRKMVSEEIRIGSPVFAAYEESGDQLTATRVRIDPPRTSAGPLNNDDAPGAGATPSKGSAESSDSKTPTNQATK